MVGTLLARGMLAGLVAGLLCFAFMRAFGEPPIAAAILVESEGAAHEHPDAGSVSPDRRASAPAANGHDGETEISRPVQAGIGLFTGTLLYTTAFGGIFALAFASLAGHSGTLGPRATALTLALGGFLAIHLVPSLIYPANPPAVGNPETIRLRTALYFATIAISLAALLVAGMLRGRLVARLGEWNATITGGVAYLAAMLVAGAWLPAMQEVPATFPADILWSFRLASIGTQAVMWLTLGLVFGWLAEHAMRRPHVKHHAADTEGSKNLSRRAFRCDRAF